jgi:TatD DNase family protein
VDDLRVISDSVDLETSLKNIEISKKLNSVLPFVGIHPEIFQRPENANISNERMDSMLESVAGLLMFARGIGEIGLDSRYSQFSKQEYLLMKLLSLAETSNLPITFHCRETVSKILDEISSYSLANKMLFHWFAGSDSELRKLHEKGFYVSFGPSILFSRRMAGLVENSDTRLILVETDSPTNFRSIVDGPSSPFLTNSVVFKIGLILGMPFDEVCEFAEANTNKYLSTQD